MSRKGAIAVLRWSRAVGSESSMYKAWASAGEESGGGLELQAPHGWLPKPGMCPGLEISPDGAEGVLGHP